MITTAPAAGWYQDPSDPASMRWWSGEGWTDHVQPLAHQQPTPAPGVPSVGFAPSVPTSSGDARWTSNYTEDELTLYTSRGHSAKPADTGQRAAVMVDGRTFISWDQNGDGVPDPVGSAATGAAWFIAGTLIVSIVLMLVVNGLHAMGVVPSASPYLLYGPGLPLLIVSLVAANRDGVELRSRGFASAHWAWMLLGPIVYLARRAWVLRGHRGAAGPLVMYLVTLAIYIALVVFATILSIGPATAGQSGDPVNAIAQKQIASTVELEMQQKGVTMDVDCSKADVQLTPGATFQCTGTGQDSVAHPIQITIVDSSHAEFKVLS